MEKSPLKRIPPKKHLWIDSETLCNDKKAGGFGCINIKDFFSGLKLSWIRRYALNQINDHWCDIIDTLCGIENINDRPKILGWGSEYFTEAIKKSYPGISDFLTSLRTLHKSWVTPKENNDNRWQYQPLFYNTRIKMNRNKNKKPKAFSSPSDMGLPDTVKTRSLQIMDFKTTTIK